MAAAPAAQPAAILRGHKTQVHAAAFIRAGLDGDHDDADDGPSTAPADIRLVTGDSDGYVILWDLSIVRPRAVWRAHTNSILGLAGWGSDQIVTHGRDHKLIVWQLGVADEARMSTALPLEDSLNKTGSTAKGGGDDRPKPWMVHMLEVNAMNFCAFAWCLYAPKGPQETTVADAQSSQSSVSSSTALSATAKERLVAVPNTLKLEAVDVFHLPSQRRVNTIKFGEKEGMVMAVALFYRGNSVVLIAAFENGAVNVASLDGGPGGIMDGGPATMWYRAQPHTQPILSLDVASDHSYFLTSAADAVIAKHPIPAPDETDTEAEETTQPSQTYISGQTLSSATEEVTSSMPSKPPTEPSGISLLSAALAQQAAMPNTKARPKPPPPPELLTQPLKIINTKHAGQQGIRIRNDGRIFATAGWDARIRVYSSKTIKEVAVLKWHQLGCFAVAFAPVRGSDTSQIKSHKSVLADDQGNNSNSSTDNAGTALTATKNNTRDISVKERRLHHAAAAHWLAAGSKDGKVSLWDIF